MLHQRCIKIWGTWVAQSVKHLTLDFRSGHDFRVPELQSGVRFWADGVETARDSLSLSLPVCSSSPPPSQNKHLKKTVKEKKYIKIYTPYFSAMEKK